MITCVRVSQIEHWCSWGKAQYLPQFGLWAGHKMWIMPHTMSVGVTTDCGGREWQLDPKWAEKIRAEKSLDFNPATKYWICEHMLELD